MSQRSAPKQVIVNALGARYLATPQKAEDMIQEMVENGSLRPDSFGGYILIGPAIMEIVRIYGQSATQAQQPRGPQQQPQQHGGYYNSPQSQPQHQFGPQSHFAPAPQPQLPPPQPAPQYPPQYPAQPQPQLQQQAGYNYPPQPAAQYPPQYPSQPQPQLQPQQPYPPPPTPYTPIHTNSTDVSRSSPEVICFKVEFIAALRRAFRIGHFDAEIRFRKLKDAGDIRCDESSRIVMLVRESAKNMWAEYGEGGRRR